MNLICKLDRFVSDNEYSIIYKNNRLNIINYSEIIDFSSSLISIRCKDRVYYIEGNDLVISRMMDNEILIDGNISVIRFI